MPFTTNTTAPLWWEESGDGEPVLLVMGHIYGLGMWHRVRPALAQQYRTICFDNRGVGRSERARGPYSIADMAADAFAVLDAAGAPSAHVYGASMGGLIAQEMALTRPERVRSLVLACTGCPSDETAPSKRPTSWQYRIPTRLLTGVVRRTMYGPDVPKRLVDEDLRILVGTKTSAAALTEQARAIADYRSLDRVGAISAPTLVLHGTRDSVVDYERGVELAHAIPGARLHTLVDAGHNYSTEAPDEANAAVLGFLAGFAVRSES
jgi:pimeloyl-ACP methyl ester carboxylesterase